MALKLFKLTVRSVNGQSGLEVEMRVSVAFGDPL